MGGWLDGRDDPIVEVVGPGGVLGYTTRWEAGLVGLQTRVVEVPKRWREDPWVRYHAHLLYERGALTRGGDPSDVQQVLLASELAARREHDEQLRERAFEERLFASNPELYKAWTERRQREREAEGGFGIQERVPQSIDELIAALEVFGGDGEAGSAKEREVEAEGWLSSVLSDDELGRMAD